MDEEQDKNIHSLIDANAPKILETHFRSQMILPYGIGVQAVFLVKHSSGNQVMGMPRFMHVAILLLIVYMNSS
jgi:hypothetical protein